MRAHAVACPLAAAVCLRAVWITRSRSAQRSTALVRRGGRSLLVARGWARQAHPPPRSAPQAPSFWAVPAPWAAPPPRRSPPSRWAYLLASRASSQLACWAPRATAGRAPRPVAQAMLVTHAQREPSPPGLGVPSNPCYHPPTPPHPTPTPIPPRCSPRTRSSAPSSPTAPSPRPRSWREFPCHGGSGHAQGRGGGQVQSRRAALERLLAAGDAAHENARCGGGQRRSAGL